MAKVEWGESNAAKDAALAHKAVEFAKRKVVVAVQRSTANRRPTLAADSPTFCFRLRCRKFHEIRRVLHSTSKGIIQ